MRTKLRACEMNDKYSEVVVSYRQDEEEEKKEKFRSISFA
jgi:hypothetical protein